MDSFPEQREMTKDDYVIVLGDFGIWRDSPQQRWYLNWLEEKHFTTLFIDGNHECFHKDTDILTINGWMNIKDVVESKENILVASVNMENHNISYSKPLKKVVNYCDKLIEITSSNFKQCVTLNHDIIVNNKKIKANELLKNKFRIEDFRFHINNINPGINIRNEINKSFFLINIKPPSCKKLASTQQLMYSLYTLYNITIRYTSKHL